MTHGHVGGCGHDGGCSHDDGFVVKGWPIGRVGHTFFSKERNVLAFFYVLYKRMRRSLRSFTFFIKERGVLCVLLRSL